jgi:uncharacterized protein YchJ
LAFTFDENTGELSALLYNDTGSERYKCSTIVCHNPICMCGIVTLELVPIKVEDGPGETPEPFRVDVDIYKKSLEYKTEGKVPQKSRQSGRRLLSQLDEDDFLILQKIYFGYKNKITEESAPESIDINFDFNEVEQNGWMYAYNDVLPYGDTLIFTVNDMKYIIYDQHCLKPNCSCTETYLNIFSVDESDEKELCVFLINYKKKKWKEEESFFSDMNLNTIKTAVEQQAPDIYERLKNRHLKLKAIYANNRKQHYTPKQEISLPKVGRNDPCPCGSGKKYKKCCLV